MIYVIICIYALCHELAYVANYTFFGVIVCVKNIGCGILSSNIKSDYPNPFSHALLSRIWVQSFILLSHIFPVQELHEVDDPVMSLPSHNHLGSHIHQFEGRGLAAHAMSINILI